MKNFSNNLAPQYGRYISSPTVRYLLLYHRGNQWKKGFHPPPDNPPPSRLFTHSSALLSIFPILDTSFRSWEKQEGRRRENDDSLLGRRGEGNEKKGERGERKVVFQPPVKMLAFEQAQEADEEDEYFDKLAGA